MEKIESLRQGRVITKTRFAFEDNVLNYWCRDGNITRKLIIPYSEVTANISEVEERNVEFRVLSLLSLFFSLLLIRALYNDLYPLGSIAWFCIGIASLLAYNYIKSEYSIIESEKVNILILKDKNHDRIVNKLKEKRHSWLFARYGNVDLENDPESELRKHVWLLEEGVISEEEFQKVRHTIEQYGENDDDSENLDGEGITIN